MEALFFQKGTITYREALDGGFFQTRNFDGNNISRAQKTNCPASHLLGLALLNNHIVNDVLIQSCAFADITII